jgi:hypothetical protein
MIIVEVVDKDETSPPVDPVDVARAEYRREYARRWLPVAWAVAGGMIGSLIVLQIEMWRAGLM